MFGRMSHVHQAMFSAHIAKQYTNGKRVKRQEIYFELYYGAAVKENGAYIDSARQPLQSLETSNFSKEECGNL